MMWTDVVLPVQKKRTTETSSRILPNILKVKPNTEGCSDVISWLVIGCRSRVQVCRSRVQVCRCAGVQVYKGAGVQGCRCAVVLLLPGAVVI